MLADGHALEAEFPAALGYRDQREIRRASANVHHQNEIADTHALAPVGMALDPGVKSRLRLFEQREVLVSGLLGGLQRQLARYRVERRRHRHQYLLIVERRVRHLRVPGPTAGAPDSGATPPPAKFSGRPPARSQRQKRGRPVDPGMR